MAEMFTTCAELGDGVIVGSFTQGHFALVHKSKNSRIYAPEGYRVMSTTIQGERFGLALVKEFMEKFSQTT